MIEYTASSLNEIADMFHRQAVEARERADRERTKAAAAIQTARANTLFNVASVLRDTTLASA